jgi:hypothetical protein
MIFFFKSSSVCSSSKRVGVVAFGAAAGSMSRESMMFGGVERRAKAKRWRDENKWVKDVQTLASAQSPSP